MKLLATIPPTLLTLAALGATLTACSRSAAAVDPAAGATAAVPVRTVPIERVHRARPVRASGLVATKAEVRASFKIGGVVAELAVDEGDVITRGQVLARLATAEIDAGVMQAQAGLSKAQRDLARAQRLLADQAATRTQVADAETAVALAAAQLQAASFNRRYAVIRAPGDGRVLRRLVSAGELVGPGQPALVLSGTRDGWVVRVGLADRDVVRVHVDDPATVTAAAWNGATMTARVSEVASAATAPAGTYEVELRLAGGTPGAALLSGLIAEVVIAPTATAEVALIPTTALRDGDGRRGAVWVPTADGHAVRRAVELAYLDGDRLAIAHGLDGADAVITDGAAYLTPTSSIVVAPPATAPAEPAP